MLDRSLPHPRLYVIDVGAHLDAVLAAQQAALVPFLSLAREVSEGIVDRYRDADGLDTEVPPADVEPTDYPLPRRRVH